MSAAERIERRTDAYVAGWLEDVEGLASTGQGGRDMALVRCARRAGELVRAGLVEEGEARARLLDALESNGLAREHGGQSCRRKVDRNLRFGIERGRGSVPEELSSGRTATSLRAPVERLPVGPVHPPREELERLYRGAYGVQREPRVIAELGGRARPGINVDGIAREGLVRILPSAANDAGDPSWCSTWRGGGYRALVPLFDAAGAWRSLRARRVIGASATKELCPEGFATRGLVAANREGIALLRGKRTPSALVIVEGVPAWCAWSSHHPDVAVIGIASGSWTADFARRVPKETRVILDVDPDETGLSYARKVAETLPGRPMHGTERVSAWLHERRAILSADEQPGGPLRASRRVSFNVERSAR